MPIITISRGSYSRGKEVAEMVAQRLGYECIAREVLLAASGQFNIPEIKLFHAIQDAPSILDRIAHGKERYIAFIQAALLKQVQKDNVVYHGYAGHFFLQDIRHALKVRILADMEERITLVEKRDGMSRKVAIRFLKRIDDERRKWSKALYGIDTWDPGLYDLVINVKKMSVESAVDIICHTVEMKDFQTTPESQRALDDLVLASEVRTALTELGAEMEIYAQNGVVHIHTKAPKTQEDALAKDIERIARGVPGITGVQVQVIPLTLFE